MSDVSKEKKLIRAPGDLVSKLNEAANRQGKTFYSYLTEILEQAVRAYEMKHNLKDIIDHFELLEVHEKAGAIFVPREVLDRLINKVYHEDGENLQQIWGQTGRWYGTYLKGKFNSPVDAFASLLREGRWDLNKLTVKRDYEMIEFRCVSTLLSQERTVLLQEFIKGAMYSMGYDTLEQECFRGIIYLKFSRRA